MEKIFENEFESHSKGTTALNLDYNKNFDHPFKKSDILKILPTSGSINNLNRNGDLHFQVLQTSNPIDLCNSYLYFEIELTNITNKDITLENNFLPSLFNQMILKLGQYSIETIEDPGICSSILNFICKDPTYLETGETYGWIPDHGSTEQKITQTTDKTASLSYELKNIGYEKRKLFYKSKISLAFRLKHLFGFLQDFNRVIFNTKIELTLTRKIDDKSLFFGNETIDATAPPKLEIKTLELHVYEITLEVASEIRLLERLKSGNPIYVDYLQRISGERELSEGTSYSTNLSTLDYLPRFIFIGFKDTEIDYKKNNSLFLIKGLKSIQLRLNTSNYPLNPIEISNSNFPFFPYQEYTKLCRNFQDRSGAPQLSLQDWQSYYPIFCFDVSNTDAILDISNINVTVIIKKESNFKPRMHHLILKESKIKMKCNGGQITVIEPVKGGRS